MFRTCIVPAACGEVLTTLVACGPAGPLVVIRPGARHDLLQRAHHARRLMFFTSGPLRWLVQLGRARCPASQRQLQRPHELLPRHKSDPTLH